LDAQCFLTFVPLIHVTCFTAFHITLQLGMNYHLFYLLIYRPSGIQQLITFITGLQFCPHI